MPLNGKGVARGAAMVMIRLRGEVTPAGQLIVELPPNVPAGDVEVFIQPVDTAANEQSFTPEEIAELLVFTPSSGAQAIADGLTGTWEDLDIDDPVTWVEAVRRKQKERNQW
jgi:hypothetical protein